MTSFFLFQYKIWTITRFLLNNLPNFIKTTGDSKNSTVTGNSKYRFWNLLKFSYHRILSIPTGNSLKVRLESINDQNGKVFPRIGDCSPLKESPGRVSAEGEVFWYVVKIHYYYFVILSYAFSTTIIKNIFKNI